MAGSSRADMPSVANAAARIWLVFLVAGCAAHAPSRTTPSEPDALISTWRVVSYETWNPQGQVSTPFGDAPSGYAVFDATGHAFIQLMGNSPGAAFAAYYGTYTTDHDARVVTIRVEGSNVPSYIGTDQVRPYRVDGENLTLGVPNEYRATLVRVRQ